MIEQSPGMRAEPSESTRQAPPAPESRITAIRYLAAVLLLPLIVLWRQDNTLFTGYGYIDPWVYFGFFRNLVEFKRNLFPGTSYGSRLAWILPGAAVHTLFSPVTANYVLHLGVYTVATVSLFLTLKWVAGARRAFLAAMLFSVNPWLWSAAGWDYANGAAIAYCLLTMALLTWAALAPTRRWALLAAGMSLAALVYVDPRWVALAPLLPLYYAGLTRAWNRTPIPRSFLALCRWFGAGCMAVTVALGAANYVLDGHFFFYAPAVLEFLQPASSRAPWSQGLWADHAAAPWLWFAMVAAATSLVVLASRLRRWAGQGNAAPVLFSAQFLCALVCLAYCQARGNPVLGISYRASDLLPFSFLAMGVWFWPGVEAVRPRTYLAICCAAAAVLGIAWVDGVAGLVAEVPHVLWVGAAALAVSMVWPWRPWGVSFSLVGFFVFTSLQAGSIYANLEAHAYRDQFESLMESRSRIESIRQGHAVRFWYDDKDRAMPDAVALSSTYLWSSSILGRTFVSPPCDVEVPPSTIVAVISAGPAHGMDYAASALAGCWSEKGLRAVPVETRTVDRDSYSYTMPILRVEVVPGMWLPLTPAGSGRPSEFPLQNWKVERGEDSRAALDTVPDGVLVRTHARPASLAALYPAMTAPVAGRYRFAVRYWPGAGRFGFGAYTHDRAEPWLAYATQGNWAGSDYEMVFWVNLAEGQEFQLGLTNNNAQVLPASFLMKAVTAVRMAR
jgi:hypothetical protein